MNHLDALQLRLFNERQRLAAAKTNAEREMRAVWVRGIEREIASEREFLSEQPEMTDDELLAALENP